MISMAVRTFRTVKTSQISSSLVNSCLRIRTVSSVQPGNENGTISEASFEKVADETLERLTDQIDHILDMTPDMDSDVSLSVSSWAIVSLLDH